MRAVWMPIVLAIGCASEPEPESTPEPTETPEPTAAPATVAGAWTGSCEFEAATYTSKYFAHLDVGAAWTEQDGDLAGFSVVTYTEDGYPYDYPIGCAVDGTLTAPDTVELTFTSELEGMEIRLDGTWDTDRIDADFELWWTDGTVEKLAPPGPAATGTCMLERML